MAAADVVFFQERLASKEQELGVSSLLFHFSIFLFFQELKSAFHKYKLKQKVKYDNLKKDVTAYCRSTGQSTEEKENTALLQIKVAEMETELEEARARVENLTEELDRSQEQLKDQMTVIRVSSLFCFLTGNGGNQRIPIDALFSSLVTSRWAQVKEGSRSF